tara:strand:+ start:168 stop:674 length:507 start_codon:yes stop_codon:yes gene_type:complete
MTHYALKKRGCHLCSLCYDSYQNGIYYSKGLRSSLNKNPLHKYNHYKIDPTIGKMKQVANRLVKDMKYPQDTSDLISYIKLVSHSFTTKKLWNLLYKNCIWLDAKTAQKIMNIFREWKYVHVVCPRVLDTWNLQEGSLAWCYYRILVDYRNIVKGIYPKGEIIMTNAI